MKYQNKPRFTIKRNLQKSKTTGVYFSDVTTPEILLDICQKITGQSEYDCCFVGNEYEDEFLPSSYNKGRMAVLEYKNDVSYITFSEKRIEGRNSSVQSVSTAFNIYFSNPYPQKKLYYYFVNTSGNAETDYQVLYYRLMSTIGFTFLNASPSLARRIVPFTSIDDIIFNRRVNAGRNQSNNSTFITKGNANEIQIYGKTYGANKYETSLFCYALTTLCQHGQKIKLFEMLEGDLKELPKSSLSVIKSMGKIEVIPTNNTLEKRIFEQSNSLRSPRYLYNLFQKLGNKHCVLCDCEIPELIQGAHVWPVADIKRARHLSQEEKLLCATDGDNGLWLCENHHKLFDEHFLTFDEYGSVIFNVDSRSRHLDFMDEITLSSSLPEFILTDKFLEYLWLRKQAV